MKKSVLIGMSGGVDSSTAALLLQEQGYHVIGVTLKFLDDNDDDTCEINSKLGKTCCSLEDVEDARRVCYKLGIEHHVFNFVNDFRNYVINPFIKSYQIGETPNPCIECNRYIKFDKMLARANIMNCDYIATGHYSKITFNEESQRYLLTKAKDNTKDQTYMLYSLTQEQLSKTLFPLGGMTKPEIRDIAEKNGLINARKPDSQDICFVKDGDYAKFIQKEDNYKPKPGNFIDSNGNILGKHKGIIHYTIGQRKGLGLSFDSPRYVTAKDVKTNTVTLGKTDELLKSSLTARECNFISIEKLEKPLKVMAKTRYSQAETPATISLIDNNLVLVEFETSQRAITSGQSVVFYENNNVVGGGIIS